MSERFSPDSTSDCAIADYCSRQAKAHLTIMPSPHRLPHLSKGPLHNAKVSRRAPFEDSAFSTECFQVARINTICALTVRDFSLNRTQTCSKLILRPVSTLEPLLLYILDLLFNLFTSPELHIRYHGLFSLPSKILRYFIGTPCKWSA